MYRFGYCTLWTAYVLARYRPRFITIQYSFILLCLLALYKLIHPGDMRLIVDCHTKALRRTISGIFAALFWRIKKWSFANCDLCIIHNEELISAVRALSDNYLVIPDPLPAIEFLNDSKPNILSKYRPEIKTCVFVCSYDVDEPIQEMIKAAKDLSTRFDVFMTGAAPDGYLEKICNERIIFTGFIPLYEFHWLLNKSMVVVSLTTEDSCLQSAAYEAMAMGKAFVTSDKRSLRKLLGNSAIYVNNDSKHIVDGVNEAFLDAENMGEKIYELGIEVDKMVDKKLNAIRALMANS